MLKYLAWRNWAIIEYNSCKENIFLIFYIGLIEYFISWNFILTFFIFYIMSALATTYGYLINDYSDRVLDKKHQKSNVFENDKERKARFIVIFFLILSNTFAYLLFQRIDFLILWGIWLFFTTFYSLKPFRFKEKGTLGLAVVVFAQRILPTLIVFSIFGWLVLWKTLIITLYIATRGIISDLRHQIEDYENDLSTATKTSVVEIGLKKAKKIFRILLNLDVSFLSLVVLIIILDGSRIQVLDMQLIWLLVFYYVALIIYIYHRFTNRQMEFDPFYIVGILNFIHLGFPSFYLPFFLLFMLIFLFKWNIILFIFFVLITKMFTIDKIKNNLILFTIRKYIK